jgi:hypothetical protein
MSRSVPSSEGTRFWSQNWRVPMTRLVSNEDSAKVKGYSNHED